MDLSAWRVQIRPEVSFARKLLRTFFEMAGEDSNGEKTDTSDVDTKRAVRERLEDDYAQKTSMKRKIR